MDTERSIFVTGFPGFIAERLVAKMARPGRSFILLVQPEMAERARDAAARIAAERGIDEGSFRIIPGDITRPYLGIAAAELDDIRGAVTDVFHLAAIYDLAVAKEPAFRVNVEGTANVNAFCETLPHLHRYNYISTCYVAGRRTGVIREDELEHDSGFRNHYEETKYVAEVSVRDLMGRLPVTIFRPSVVVGDSRTGETAKYDGIYSLIQFLALAPSVLRLVNVGNDRVTLNLVPVDHVVDAIAALAFDDAAEGKTLAIADPQPLTTAELFDACARAMSGKGSVVRPPAALVEPTLLLPFSPALTGLPHHGVPYFFLDQSYDTSVADALLSRHSIKCPSFRDYVPKLVDFVKKHPKL